jgi:hypothetical protein
MKDCSSKESPITPMMARKPFFLMGENVVTQTFSFANKLQGKQVIGLRTFLRHGKDQ